jgi:hypothetical protein
MSTAATTTHCQPCRCIIEATAALSGYEISSGCGSAGAALPGQEGSSVRLEKGSDNQHVVWGGVYGMARWWKGWRPPWLPWKTTSLEPAETPQQRSLQEWRLSCSSDKEDAIKKTTTVAAGMSLRWRLQEQAFDGAMRLGGGGGGRVLNIS